MSETSAAPELIIGHFIRLLRVSHNINQIELAKRLKTSRTYLSQVENGQREPGLGFLKKVTTEFQFPLFLLFLSKEDAQEYPQLMEIFKQVMAQHLLLS